MNKMINFICLAGVLCRQDIEERFAGSLLGSIWVLICPLVQLFMYIVIFGRLMGGRFGSGETYSYGVYVAAGLLGWTCFANTLQRICRVFVDKRHIIGRVRVDLAVFPLSICLAELIPLAAGAVLLTLTDLGMGWRPAGHLLAWALFGLYCQQVLAVGLGLFLACCAVFARDVTEATGIALQMAFWFTPIVYLPSILPDWLNSLLVVNPMLHVTGMLQQFFVFGEGVAPLSAICAGISAHAALILGLYTLHRLQKDIRDVL